MKIAINNSPLSSGHQFRGIGTYARLLIASLQQFHPEHSYVITDTPYSSHADVVHHPFFDLFFLTLPLKKPIPSLVTVHDVIPLLYPKAYPTGVRGLFKFWIQKMSLTSTDCVATDSNCSTRDVIEHLSLPPRQVHTVYLAADPAFSPSSKDKIDRVKQTYQLTSPYYLYVGDINYNKNLPCLLRAFHTVKDKALLVIVSKTLRRDNPAAASLFSLIDSLGLEDRLRILNAVPNQPVDEVCALYSGAYFYIQPSLYEGFGLPILEAQACETPVISSLGGSLPEICSDSVWTFDPQDTPALENILSTSLSISLKERLEYVEKGTRNRSRFSWEKTAHKMVELYQQCGK